PPLLAGIIGAVILLRRAKDRSGILRFGAVLGIALTLALLVQTALVAAAAICLAVILLLPPEERDARWAAALGFALAALVVWLYRVGQPPGYPDNSWYLGLPHAAVLAAVAAASAFSALVLSRGGSRLRAGLIAVPLAALLWAAIPAAAEAGVEGLRFFGGDPWLATINEFQPLFFARRGNLVGNLCSISAAVLLPILFTGHLRRRGSSRWILLIFAAAYLAATLVSLRFMVCAGPLLAIAGAVAVADLQQESRWLGAAGALLILAPSIWICWPLLREPEPPVGVEAQPYLRAAAFLKTQRGPRSHVLAPWSWGHVFEFPGGEIPVVDGFGSSIGSTDFENALGVVLLSREESVAAYCRPNRIRYLGLQNPL